MAPFAYYFISAVFMGIPLALSYVQIKSGIFYGSLDKYSTYALFIVSVVGIIIQIIRGIRSFKD